MYDKKKVGFLMKKSNKGFVFVETIIVTCVLLTSLIVVYSLYVNSTNTESRYLRYDDTAKLYQSYYLKKYLEGFDFRILKQNIELNCNGFLDRNSCSEHNTCSWKDNSCKKQTGYEIIWQGRSDIFGSSYSKEAIFFDYLWNTLKIKNIYMIPGNISSITQCDNEIYDAICANNSLMIYLNGLDNLEGNQYYLIFEFASSMDGTACQEVGSSCLSYYANMTVGD